MSPWLTAVGETTMWSNTLPSRKKTDHCNMSVINWSNRSGGNISFYSVYECNCNQSILYKQDLLFPPGKTQQNPNMETEQNGKTLFISGITAKSRHSWNTVISIELFVNSPF